MLKFLSKLFRKSPSSLEATSHSSVGASSFETSLAIPAVETVPLSLHAILESFPEDLQRSIQQWPDETVTIALPLSTIMKQIPNGAVKMSLASVQRQAPTGVLRNGPREDKRMVEVPLRDLLQKLPQDALRRRLDQRPFILPESGCDLFGDKENPFALAPVEYEAFVPATAQNDAVEIPEEDVAASASEGIVAPPPGLADALAKSAPKPARVYPKSNKPPLILPIGELSDAWPEPIRSEVIAMNGARVELPVDEVSARLARGRVTFSWGEIRAWSESAAPTTEGCEDTELVLPLRVVAPAFLQFSKRPSKPVAEPEIGEDIPELFQGPVPPPKPEPEPQAQVLEGLEDLSLEPSPEPESGFAPAGSTLDFPVATDPEPSAEPLPATDIIVLSEEPVAEEAPAFLEAEPVNEPLPPAQVWEPQNLGELFHEPEKPDWSPEEIMQKLTRLPGITGAVVALLEGLVVAHALPEHLNPETFAAFLPQVFARLNQYSAEMQLGEIDEVAITSHGAPCRMFRLGEVFFAVLGEPGAVLPDHALRLCAQALIK